MTATRDETLRIPYEDVHATLSRCLRARGFEAERAARCAAIFVDNTVVGVASHGLNRFPRFLEWIDRGWVDPVAAPERVSSWGSLERWDGRLGPGPLNAQDCMNRAIALAAEHGLGCVALRNTNHWMRAGTYAWQAAEAGCLGICLTNTEPNLPPWGAARPALGNNPIALAIPRDDGRHVLYDGAMSQFSYGAMEDAARRGEALPVPGGFNQNGELTQDPAAIVASQRPLPIGFWKGAGLSLLLDLFAAVLSGGATTRELGEREAEFGVSQTFLAFDRSVVGPEEREAIEATLSQMARIDADVDAAVTFPGQRLLDRRAENLQLGVPVDATVWETIRHGCARDRRRDADAS